MCNKSKYLLSHLCLHSPLAVYWGQHKQQLWVKLEWGGAWWGWSVPIKLICAILPPLPARCVHPPLTAMERCCRGVLLAGDIPGNAEAPDWERDVAWEIRGRSGFRLPKRGVWGGRGTFRAPWRGPMIWAGWTGRLPAVANEPHGATQVGRAEPAARSPEGHGVSAPGM